MLITEFYGHGLIIPYELDWVAVRAGWTLEELTFEDFGYMGPPIKEDSLLQLHRDNYAQYLKTGSHSTSASPIASHDVYCQHLMACASIAQKWWKENRKNWTRLLALKLALGSSSPKRQLRAISYLRFARTACDGLTPTSFEQELRSLVARAATLGDSVVREQAEYLLADGFTWMYRQGR